MSTASSVSSSLPRPLKIAINGYGRIGRCILRALHERGLRDHSLHERLEVVAINELADCKTIAHLTKYDSTHGRFPAAVELQPDQLLIDDRSIRLLHVESVADLPWAELGVDLVLECSGAFSDRATAERHLAAGAKRVLFSQPARADVDATIVYGVNHQRLSANHTIVSNASCTTNCIVPVIDALDKALGVESGVITTIHSAMNDQP